MSNLSVIIVGAGKGTRMKSNISKLLHKVGNLEMINHVINTAKQLDTQEICVVCSEENIEEIKKNIDNNIITTIQYERLGTGHATQIGFQALKHKDNDILVMYGDMPLIKAKTYQKLLDLLKTTDTSIANLGYECGNLDNRWGRFITEGDKLEKITEYKDADESVRKITLVNAGIVAIKGGILEKLLSQVKNNNASKEYYLTDIVQIANENKLTCRYAVDDDEGILGINSREELSIAEKVFQSQKRKEFMTNGTTLVDPTSVYFSYDTEIGKDVVIEPNVVFLPKVKIGNNITIHSFSYLEDCILEDGVSVGPFARIRPKTTLKSNCHIGNFVEIKKSTIGEGTKIGHLTYIGDTTIGNNTNIGAGTITCNYDGFSKFQSNIGNNCFIGSNTVMISPINIEDGAMTGAGSIITKNVNKDDIAIARAKQENLSGKAVNYRNKRKK